MPHDSSPTPDSSRVISGLAPPEDAATAARRAAGGAAPALDLDSRVYARALDCVSCGLCLPTCPTYAETGLEGDSPRGRIVLMKSLADGAIAPSAGVREHLDRCLDCRACETACPSGVVYHELIEQSRSRLKPARRASWADAATQAAARFVFPSAARLKAVLLPVRLLHRVGLWHRLAASRLARTLPQPLRRLKQMAPVAGPLWEAPLARFHPRHDRSSPPVMRVSFLAGCVGSAMFQDVNRQSIALLQRAGCDVYVPRGQGCCGALDQHSGRVGRAIRRARRNINAMLAPDGRPVDAIVTNVAGCGAMLKEYDELLRDEPDWRERAGEFTRRVRDICELLVELDWPDPPHAVHRRGTYHDACHHVHAQGIAAAPRRLLGRIKGLGLVPLGESTMCCGAAGTYSLAQPAMAERLAARKLRHIEASGARLCITANAGCAMQITAHAREMSLELDVVHPVTLLHEACFGKAEAFSR